VTRLAAAALVLNVILSAALMVEVSTPAPAFSQEFTPASAVPHEQLVAQMWRAGDLSWKLDPHQLEIYDAFNEWNRRRHTPEYVALCRTIVGAMDSVWDEELCRRFGKTAKWIVQLDEIAIQRPGSVLTYGTAFQKDIGDIIVPLQNMLAADAPDDVRPRYRGSYGAYSSPVLHFPSTDSVIKLVGIDKNPDGLRGRFSDGIVISEARDVRDLESIVRGILLPQFQRRAWAFLALESSTPKDLDHDLITKFKPDAIARSAYVMRTLDANQVITADERERYIREAGGRGHPECEREYFCRVTRDPERMIVPEFDRAKHVRPMVRPEHAQTFVFVDPGMSDRCGIIWCYWDWMAQVLVVERSWAQFNAGTDLVAKVMRDTEAELWGTGPAGALTYWSPDRRKLMPNPVERWTDVDLRLAHDLKSLHGIDIAVIDKAPGSGDADVQQLRLAVHSDQVVVLPDSGPLADELEAGKRKKGGSPNDWERSPVFGHYDLIATLKYGVRKVWLARSRNPFPPEGALLTGENIAREPWAEYSQQSKGQRAVNAAFGGGRRR
jgi:hypothetical protein